MKAKRIILIRHGESEGNVDKTRHETVADHDIALTDAGIVQAVAAGKRIKEWIGDESVRFYTSPYKRTRQTLEGLQHTLGTHWTVREDVRLREQEWGHWRKEEETLKLCKLRQEYGHFFFRFPDGESGADVFDRLTTFIDTLHRDMESADFPDNAIIVSHGYAIRVLLMRWFHYSVEDFQILRNPDNCEFFVMERYEHPVIASGRLLGYKPKYQLMTPMRKYENSLNTEA